MIEFKAWPKILRLENAPVNFDITITEKIDGTNAAIIITDDGQIAAQSRNKLITLDDDNYGFAKWVQENKEELLKLGRGHHFGEWWGLGIQRNYDQLRKRFSLFNVHRWSKEGVVLPNCCDTVPILYKGPYTDSIVNWCRDFLKLEGSQAAPGFRRPEGLVVYFDGFDVLRKVIIDK